MPHQPCLADHEADIHRPPPHTGRDCRSHCLSDGCPIAERAVAADRLASAGRSDRACCAHGGHGSRLPGNAADIRRTAEDQERRAGRRPDHWETIMSDRWIEETVAPAERKWEEFYRNRFQHDKRVRTTHGVNCTGSCSWEVFVKDGIVTWELQATDYPQLEEGLPPYEPRGCQRGISYSWYLYSPIRVKYPYARGVLIDMFRQAKIGRA